MPLNPLKPGLRVINDSRNAARVDVIVAPGEELEVSEELAAQLAEASPSIRPVKAKAAPVKKAAPKATE